MGVGRRLLEDGEELVIDLHPHGRALVLPLAALAVLSAGGGYLAATVPAGPAQGPLRLGVVGTALLLALLLTVRPVLRWVCTHYLVTTARVAVRRGVLRRRGHDLPLARITDVSFGHGPLERLVGAGTLVVDSADGGRWVWPVVPQVEAVQREVWSLIQDEGQRQVAARRVEAWHGVPA